MRDNKKAFQPLLAERLFLDFFLFKQVFVEDKVCSCSVWQRVEAKQTKGKGGQNIPTDEAKLKAEETPFVTIHQGLAFGNHLTRSSVSTVVDFVVKHVCRHTISVLLHDGKECSNKSHSATNENDLGWPKDDYDNPVAPTTNFILNNYFDNLIIKKQGNNYIITTDPNIKLRGTNLTVDALSALINYGTLLVPPYPYIDDIFEVFADSLQDYYSLWQEENGESLLNYEESEEEV